MVLDNIEITFWFSLVQSIWGVVLLRLFIQWVLVPRALNFANVAVPFSLQFLLHLFIFTNTNGISPYTAISVTIIVNGLILLIWVKAKIFHILIAAIIYSVVVLSVDMSVVIALNILVIRGLIPEEIVVALGFALVSFVAAPLAYKGLKGVMLLEEERRYVVIRRLQIVLTLCCFTVTVIVNIFSEVIPNHFWARGVDLWMFPFVMVLFLFSMLAGTEFLNTQHYKKIKEIEHLALQQYTKDVEGQSKEMQRFRHDYVNILLSLERYIQESDEEELKEFFYKKLMKTSESLHKGAESELQKLCNVKDKEIKSILIVKIQKMISAGIKVEFEAVEEIEIMNIDTVIMVRIIGILLDNAFEEVVNLESKLVNIGLVKEEKDVIFYVSNMCKKEKYNVEVVKEGFTTKGKGRGIGLSNLTSFSSKYNNLFIETRCENHRFTQIITIGG